MNNLTICSLGSWTAKLAVKFARDAAVTLYDAYHGATAVENNATIFVTRDKFLRDRLLKIVKVSEPEAVTPTWSPCSGGQTNWAGRGKRNFSRFLGGVELV